MILSYVKLICVPVRPEKYVAPSGTGQLMITGVGYLRLARRQVPRETIHYSQQAFKLQVSTRTGKSVPERHMTLFVVFIHKSVGLILMRECVAVCTVWERC